PYTTLFRSRHPGTRGMNEGSEEIGAASVRKMKVVQCQISPRLRLRTPSSIRRLAKLQGMTTCTLSFSSISAEKHVLGCRNSFRGSLVITASRRNGERPKSLLLRNLVKTQKKLQTTAQSPY